MIRNRFEVGRGRREGFTLVEILVTLVLIALLVGVVLPSVIRQLDRGEPTRISQDLESVRSAAQMFRMDVRRWPGSLQQLVEAPDTVTDDGWGATELDPANQDISTTNIPTQLRKRWNGPYLEVGQLAGTDLLIGAGATVQGDFVLLTWGSASFITAYINDVTEAQAEAISEIVDGHSNISTADEGGRVRYDGTVLWYLMSPIN
jgi:prepilin-type N-terminal cleavage/methylation domain-containing protein